MISQQLLRFLIAGGIAATANFGSRFVFEIYFSYGTAVFFAYLIGMLVAFLLMRAHVFNAVNGPLLPQIVRFLSVNAFAVVQTLIISLLFARWALPSIGITDYAEAIGHLIGVLVPVLTSYVGHKFLTFR